MAAPRARRLAQLIRTRSPPATKRAQPATLRAVLQPDVLGHALGSPMSPHLPPPQELRTPTGTRSPPWGGRAVAGGQRRSVASTLRCAHTRRRCAPCSVLRPHSPCTRPVLALHARLLLAQHSPVHPLAPPLHTPAHPRTKPHMAVPRRCARSSSVTCTRRACDCCAQNRAARRRGMQAAAAVTAAAVTVETRRRQRRW